MLTQLTLQKYQLQVRRWYMDTLIKYDGKQFDLEIKDGKITMGGDLQTAVLISLFTNRLAENDDPLPDTNTDPQGFWADTAYPLTDNYLIGSKLWLLYREKESAETLNRAKQYAEEALQWILDMDIAKKITIKTEWVRSGVLGLEVLLERPKGVEAYRFDYVW
jgi:phage gp46-like protein